MRSVKDQALKCTSVQCIKSHQQDPKMTNNNNTVDESKNRGKIDRRNIFKTQNHGRVKESTHINRLKREDERNVKIKTRTILSEAQDENCSVEAVCLISESSADILSADETATFIASFVFVSTVDAAAATIVRAGNAES